MSGFMANIYDQDARPLWAQRPAIVVARAAAALPNNAQAPLFRVRGGQVRLLQLLRKFDVAADATVTNLTAVANPDSLLTDVNLHTATAIASVGAGTLQAINGAGIGAAVTSGGALSGLQQPIGLDVGTIDALTNANNAAARVSWYAMYEAITPGANLIPVSAAGLGLSGQAPLQLSPFRKWIKRKAATLPATAQTAILRITGGPVLLWGLVGRVQTAMSGTATNLTVVGNALAAGIADVNMCTATAVTSLAVGNFLSLQGAGIGSALAVGGAAQMLATPLIVDAGTIDLLTSATNTGQVEWTAIWQKLHPAGNLIVA